MKRNTLLVAGMLCAFSLSSLIPCQAGVGSARFIVLSKKQVD